MNQSGLNGMSAKGFVEVALKKNIRNVYIL